MYRKARKRADKERKQVGWGAISEGESADYTQADLQALDTAMQGDCLVYGDPGYDAARQLSNPAFQSFPQIIAYCEAFNDVRECLRFARKFGLWCALRSGGHSTAGYSVNTGILVDVSRIRYAVVDPRERRVVVGAGTNFGLLNSTLQTYGLHIPTGGCPDVCVAGYMQGGGYGFTSREYGIQCDNVVEILVLLADGRYVRANRERNADLFWAVRGGTGGNFGVLLEVTYQAYPHNRYWGFGLKWPLKEAPAALERMQKQFMRDGADPKLGYMTFLAYQQGEPVLLMRGMYHGTKRRGREVLGPMLKTNGAELQLDRMGSYEALNEYLLEHPDPLPTVPDIAAEDKQSTYIEQRLTRKQWQSVCDMFESTPYEWNIVVIEPYGGKIQDWEPSDNAFMHREVDMDFFVDVFWMNAEQEVIAKQYLDDFMDLMAPFSDGHQYQNYPRSTVRDYRWAYWGDLFPELLRIKKKYDPSGFFRYQQSIRPPGKGEPKVRRSRKKPLFGKAPIQAESYSKSFVDERGSIR